MSQISTTATTADPVRASGTTISASGVNSRLSPAMVTAALFVAALVIYNVSAVLAGRTHSPNAAYFQYLADALLHGRLYVLNTPSLNDLTLFEGQWYVGFPPLAALLLLPWVAVSGINGVNTVVFGALVGATSVALAFLTLQSLARRGWTRLSLTDNIWLTVLFGLGSVHWYMSTMGAVWFLGQICAVLFIFLGVWLAVNSASPFLCGSAFAIALLSRPACVFSYPVLAGIALQHIRNKYGRNAWRSWLKWIAISGIPIALIAALLAGYNYARFKSFSDFGYMTMNVDESVAGDLHKYGQFAKHYILHNFYTMFLAGWTWNAVTGRFVPDQNGMSIFFTTPALLSLLWIRKRTPFVIGAGLAVLSMVALLMTYYNTGWIQFGDRFSLDFMVPLLILLAVAAEEIGKVQMRILIALGVIINAWGVWWFRFFA
jgi:hypothetical protein